MESETLAGAKKNCARQGRTIVFIDESGLSERPTRVRTWAPVGETPILQYSFNWKQLSVIGGVSFTRFYFRLFPGAIKGPQMVEFLRALRTQIKRKLLIVWDGLPVHKSRVVRQYVDSLKGAIQLEQLPAYAPELNPVEYLWGHLKHRELGNFCPAGLSQLSHYARRRLRSMQRRPTLVTAFWKQAELPF
jgi:transposase